jgi:hypothetical protein
MVKILMGSPWYDFFPTHIGARLCSAGWPFGITLIKEHPRQPFRVIAKGTEVASRALP